MVIAGDSAGAVSTGDALAGGAGSDSCLRFGFFFFAGAGLSDALGTSASGTGGGLFLTAGGNGFNSAISGKWSDMRLHTRPRGAARLKGRRPRA